MLDKEYRDACQLVLSACDREIAFEDYAALVGAYRANGDYRIDGTPREDLEARHFLGWTPFNEGVDHLVMLIRTADVEGIDAHQLADLFEIVRPDSLYQALCVLEDALVILDRIPESVDAEEPPF
jgi:hypothetical protein